MSPFDLPGPLFLVFYLFCGAVALTGVAMFHNFAEPGEAVKANLSDPYLIAYLRGGRKESLRVATISLIDRGLLKVTGSAISAIQNAPNKVSARLEELLLAHCQRPREASSVHNERCFDGTMRRYDEELSQAGLMPTGSMKTDRAIRLFVVLTFLLGVAIIKIAVAFER